MPKAKPNGHGGWKSLQEWKEIKKLFFAANRWAYIERYHRLGKFIERLSRSSKYGDACIREIAVELNFSVTTIYAMRKFYLMYPKMTDVRFFITTKWPWRAISTLLRVSSAAVRARFVATWGSGGFHNTAAFVMAVRKCNRLTPNCGRGRMTTYRRLLAANKGLDRSISQLDVAVSTLDFISSLSPSDKHDRNAGQLAMLKQKFAILRRKLDAAFQLAACKSDEITGRQAARLRASREKLKSA